jgi:hypothetical protein
MSTRIAAGLVLGIAVCGLAGYGIGSGWVRFGAPANETMAGAALHLERSLQPEGAARPELLPWPIVDAQVIRAQATTPAPAPPAPAPAPAASPAPAKAVIEIREASDPNAPAGPPASPAYVTRDFSHPVRLRSPRFTVRLDSTDPNATVSVSVAASGASLSGTRDTTDKSLFSFDLSQAPAGQTISLAATGVTPNLGTSQVQVIVPKPGELVAPMITLALNNAAGKPATIPGDNDPTLSVYGSYLKLFGQAAPANPDDLDFLIYALEGKDYVFKSLVSNPQVNPTAGTQAWDATLTLPGTLPLNTPIHVFAINDPIENQQFSNKLVISRVPFTLDPSSPPKIVDIFLPGPDLSNPHTNQVAARHLSDTSGTPGANRFYANQSRLIFHGTGAPKGTIVRVYVDGFSDRVIATSLVVADSPTGEWFSEPSNFVQPSPAEILADKLIHTARATATQGNQTTPPADLPVTFQLSAQGPTFDSVNVTSSNVALGTPSLTVRFTGSPLDPDLAKKAASYSLLPSNGSGFYDASAAQPPDLAAFDAARNLVTLTFKTIKPNDYQLQLAPDPANTNQTLLKDLFGNPVTGPTARAVTRLADATETTDGIPKAEKAPNAVFPEFNTPRPESNGFNPSDHVDTRVSRLYFYRDARRVAEIINRDLKSYNQAAVDTRRRLAEKARSSADALTDERRLQEVKAVRAAQGTREAQRRVDQAQAALQQSQASAASAKQNLAVLQSRQGTLQQQLTEARNAAATPPAPAGATTPAPAPTQTQTDAAAAVTSLTRQLDTVNQQIAELQDQASQAGSQLGDQTTAVQSAQADLQSARATEAQNSDDALVDQQKEDRARENQFRLEVAAAHEDPNSYVPGQPDSIDPVLQVSISVIGEGVIQLRGPIKGINIIRRMINEIDAPAGQCRIALHTVQINGEHEPRMEKVASRIQAYVDHSRFLTAQSAQMLRNSVVRVASMKAQEACALLPPEQASDPKYAATQDFRDRKYQEAFFGVDFINELHDLDAEFLHTSNKLLSLHSMDTTSLASALFMLALAKNETRLEILEDFKARLASDLPEAESSFELSSGRTGKEHHHKVLPLAQNVRFQSLMGFFNAEVEGNDTLNALQREFIKLAQILKSRLVTELEYNQRFKERGLIEDRLGDYQKELKEQKDREDKAKKLRDGARDALNQQRTVIQEKFADLERLLTANQQDVSVFNDNINDTMHAISRIVNDNRGQFEQAIFAAASRSTSGKSELIPPGTNTPIPIAQPSDARNYFPYLTPRYVNNVKDANIEVKRLAEVEDYLVKLTVNAKFTFKFRDGSEKHFLIKPDGGDGEIVNDASQGTTPDDLRRLTSTFFNWILLDKEISTFTFQFSLRGDYPTAAQAAAVLVSHLSDDITKQKLTRHMIFEYAKALSYFQGMLGSIRGLIDYLTDQEKEVTGAVIDVSTPPLQARNKWRDVRNLMQETFQGKYSEDVTSILRAVDTAFNQLTERFALYMNAERTAREARAPLDAKKLLDSLIDEIEDKYVDLLEGIRSHTANIDGYVKTIATALDDDFNTQFYYPAFKEIRQSSTYWDVTLAQVETTNILTNNRMFAKVEPQATMEFDLPKRDILINEAMNGAKALIDSYGALVADPSFLALTKLQSGQPTSSPAQGFGSGGNTVRNVLPGLPRSNDEQLLSQSPAGRREFGAPLEALIPDPAVYKFETGTGFEIRPVIQPDGQSVVFHLQYMYTTNVREPVRADEKHLGRIKRHFIDTEVQLGNYELREVSRYVVALKASRTSRGVPLFEDIPAVGILFRPLPSSSSSLQQNVILGQATIFPTLFDLMGLRWVPAIADLDSLRLRNSEFIVRGRARDVMNRVFDYSTSRVDESLRVPPAERRPDLYRSQETIPDVHPNGYHGPGLNLHDSQLQEGYDPTRANPPSRFAPEESRRIPPDWSPAPGSTDHDGGHSAGTVAAPAASTGSVPPTQPEPSRLSLLPPSSVGTPSPPPSSTVGSGRSARSPASGGARAVNPAQGDRLPPLPPTGPSGTSPGQAPSLEPPQPSTPVSARSRANFRPLSDPGAMRAAAPASNAPAPASAKPRRRSLISRMFGTGQ